MRIRIPYFCYILLLILIGYVVLEEFSRDWAIKIKGNENVAKRIAQQNNLEYIGKVGNLDQTYHFKERSSQSRTKRNLMSHKRNLRKNRQVYWLERQKTIVRTKRNTKIKNSYESIEQIEVDKEIKDMFNDPEWINQWYLYDARKSRTNIKEDLHVIPVWKMNFTGRGVTVSILDDGLEHNHPDLKDNYDPQASTDINDNDDDPMPHLDPGTSNEHGTRCASEISMVANNKICGVGIAYNAKIGGIRMLDGEINDLVEAKSLGFNNNHIDIYSSSWGPPDNGMEMDKPGHLALEALRNGVTKGRRGKGNLYVWAAGNGGVYNDSCACDGYVSSIYTISINSINPDASIPFYLEKCSSTMASTFSTYHERKSQLVVADVNGKCSNNHSGTSAAAPYAAGIFALALEANPNLTWRDVKYLLTWTSQVSSLKHSPGWKMNKAGFWVSDVFGFGQMDAKNFVVNAKTWVTVPEMTSCTLKKEVNLSISNIISKNTTFNGSDCYAKVKLIEHVVVIMTFQYSARGALFIVLKSPHGMNTTLLPLRYMDNKNDTMKDWPFNSVHNWGESPSGLWTITFEDKRNDKKTRSGIIKYVSMTFYGTNTIPHHILSSEHGKRKYDDNYNHVKNAKREWRLQ